MTSEASVFLNVGDLLFITGSGVRIILPTARRDRIGVLTLLLQIADACRI